MAPQYMNAVVFDGTLHLEKIPRPLRKSNEVLIRVLMAGICNTDIEITRGYIPGFKGIVGHEFIGIIEETDNPALAGGFTFNPSPIVVNEITLIGSRCGKFTDAIDFIKQHNPPLERCITDRMPLSQSIAAFEKAKEKGALKIVLNP